jgi:hypothetical protein
MVVIESILGIEEGDDSISDISQKLMKLLLSIESVSLVESGIIVAHVLEEFLIEVMPQGRNQEDDSADQSDRF